MASEITRDDIIDDLALEAPHLLADNFLDLEKAIDKVIAKSKLSQQVLTQATTIRKLTDEVKKLKEQQIQLLNTQKKLVDEQKKLSESFGALTDVVGTMNARIGSSINSLKIMAQQFKALAKNPWILALLALIAVIAALVSSVKTFYTATGEGEDMLEQQKAVWTQFFDTLKKGWSDLGKSISNGLFGDSSSKDIINSIFEVSKTAFPFMYNWLQAMQIEFNRTADEALALSKVIDKIDDDISRNIIKSAETETKSNKLILDSQDKILYSDEQRLAFLVEGIALKEKQLVIDKNIAERSYEALLLQIGLSHSLTEAQTKSMTEKQRLDVFTGEENKRLAESYAHIIQLEGNFYQEVKRNSAKVIALREEIRKEGVKVAMQGVEDRVAVAEAEMNRLIAIVENETIAGTRLREDADKEILRLKKQFADDIIDQEIKGLSKVLGLNILNADERAAVEKRLVKLKVDYNTALFDQTNQLEEVTFEAGKTRLEKFKEIYTTFTNDLGNLFQSFTDNRISDIQRQEKELAKSLDRQLYLAGTNEKEKEILKQKAAKKQEELDKKRIAAIRRQAIFDKIVGATQAAINTAVAVTKAGILTPLGIATAIAGAAEVAAILAKNIPAYEFGGTTTARTIIAGEAGMERYQTPSGIVGYTPSTATLMNLPIGTEITTHDETMRGLALESLASSSKNGGSAVKKSQPKVSNGPTIDLVRSGSIVYEARKYSETFTKYVRSINMGRWL